MIPPIKLKMSASKIVYLKSKINNLKTSVKLIYWLEEPVLLFGHYEFNISELFFWCETDALNIKFTCNFYWNI